jgi:GT2 family glycosyltransferase
MTATSNPLVSVVLAAYNAERYVREAVESVLQQTYSEFELIIVDDASTDSTLDILATYSDPRIIILRNERNLGPYGAANRGISMVRGELIARHDADDVSMPDRFARQAAAFLTNPNLVLAGSSYFIIDRKGKTIDITLLPDTNSKLQKRLEHGNIFIQGATMFRKTAFDKVGGYREYFPVSQDYDLFLRLAEVGEIINLPEPLYNFRFHGESISRKKKELQLACRRLAWELAARRRSGQPEGEIPEDVVSVYPPESTRLFHEARGTAYLYYASGQLDQAAEALERALDYLPQLGDESPDWREWVLAHADSHAKVTGDSERGATFIKWLLDRIPDSLTNSSSKDLLAEYYAAQAFQAYETKHWSMVPSMVLAAIRADVNLLKNRGLISIAFRSLLPNK